MKFYTTFYVFLFASFFSFGQNSTRVSPHYVLDVFTEGSILLKDGTKRSEVLNYNSISKNFAIIQDEKIAPLSESYSNKIDTVYVANRKFFRKDNTFFELLLASNIVLYVEHKCNVMSGATAAGGYGTSSQVNSGISTNFVARNAVFYDLELPERYKVNPDLTYWINKNNKLTKIETLSQLRKLYKSQKNDIKTYKKSHKVDLKIPFTVQMLVAHLEGK